MAGRCFLGLPAPREAARRRHAAEVFVGAACQRAPTRAARGAKLTLYAHGKVGLPS